MPAGRAEQVSSPLLSDAGRGDVGVQRLGQGVMARHRVLLAAFLLQADLPARTLRPQILHLHFQRRANAREGIGEGGDQCPVAQITHRLGGDGIEQPPPLVAFQHRRLASVHNMLGAAHCGCRIMRHHLAGDQPVEQHPHRREFLLHGRRRVVLLHEFDIAGYVIGPDGWQGEAARLAPGEKMTAGAGVGSAGVRVADVGGEEFNIAPARLLAGVGDQRRNQRAAGQRRENAGRFDQRGELGGRRVGQRVDDCPLIRRSGGGALPGGFAFDVAAYIRQRVRDLRRAYIRAAAHAGIVAGLPTGGVLDDARGDWGHGRGLHCAFIAPLSRMIKDVIMRDRGKMLPNRITALFAIKRRRMPCRLPGQYGAGLHGGPCRITPQKGWNTKHRLPFSPCRRFAFQPAAHHGENF